MKYLIIFHIFPKSAIFIQLQLYFWDESISHLDLGSRSRCLGAVVICAVIGWFAFVPVRTIGSCHAHLYRETIMLRQRAVHVYISSLIFCIVLSNLCSNEQSITVRRKKSNLAVYEWSYGKLSETLRHSRCIISWRASFNIIWFISCNLR